MRKTEHLWKHHDIKHIPGVVFCLLGWIFCCFWFLFDNFFLFWSFITLDVLLCLALFYDLNNHKEADVGGGKNSQTKSFWQMDGNGWNNLTMTNEVTYALCLFCWHTHTRAHTHAYTYINPRVYMFLTCIFAYKKWQRYVEVSRFRIQRNKNRCFFWITFEYFLKIRT